jgi:hypothetical protein
LVSPIDPVTSSTIITSVFAMLSCAWHSTRIGISLNPKIAISEVGTSPSPGR